MNYIADIFDSEHRRNDNNGIANLHHIFTTGKNHFAVSDNTGNQRILINLKFLQWNPQKAGIIFYNKFQRLCLFIQNSIHRLDITADGIFHRTYKPKNVLRRDFFWINRRIQIQFTDDLIEFHTIDLAAAGVGTIGIVDADEVDLSNLQRQIIHGTADVGKAKVKSAKETMNAMNPDVTVNTYREFVTSENIMDLIKDYDFIIDGTDNFPAKFLINDACVMAKKPFSHAGIIRFKGQLMTYVPGEGPCYRCVFKNPPPKDAVPTCKQAGVIGAMGGVIGSLQAMEAIKYLIGVGDLLTGKLLTYDALKMEFHTIKLPKANGTCAVCGDHPTITELIDYEQVECDGK